MIIRLIHGIHEKEGATNMDAFAPHMRRICPNSEVSLWQYGFIGFWSARWTNGNIARDLATESRLDVRPGPEIWITHSNGAAIAYIAVEKRGARPDMIININPALDRWRSPGVLQVETIHSKSDRWVNLSQWLPGHLWGDQGKVGYKGMLSNTTNHAASYFAGVMCYQHHSGLFDPQRINQWAKFIAHRIYLHTGVKP